MNLKISFVILSLASNRFYEELWTNFGYLRVLVLPWKCSINDSNRFPVIRDLSSGTIDDVLDLVCDYKL
jgi:hypothetical protein